MCEYIKIPKEHAILLENPMDSSLAIRVTTMEALDDLIDQCRDLKLKWLEEVKE